MFLMLNVHIVVICCWSLSLSHVQSDEIAGSWLNNQAVRSAIHAETVHGHDKSVISLKNSLQEH